jgi:hypothetical protein
MSRYLIEHRLAGWVVGLGWCLVMLAFVFTILLVVMVMKSGEWGGVGTVLQLLAAGVPMVVVGSACRAVFEIADTVLPESAEEPDPAAGIVERSERAS